MAQTRISLRIDGDFPKRTGPFISQTLQPNSFAAGMQLPQDLEELVEFLWFSDLGLVFFAEPFLPGRQANEWLLATSVLADKDGQCVRQAGLSVPEID